MKLPRDNVFLSDPKQGRRYYLPRYRLAQDEGGYRLWYFKEQKRLTLHLVPYVAPELAPAVAGALPLEISPVVTLRINTRNERTSSYPSSDLNFQEVVQGGGGTWIATRMMLDWREVEDVFTALTDKSTESSLMVTRQLRFAEAQPPSYRTFLTGTPFLHPPPRPDEILVASWQENSNGVIAYWYKIQRPSQYTIRVDDAPFHVEPLHFVFNRTVHPGMFPGLETGRSEHHRREVREHEGRLHGYYQDLARANVIYYLPDRFELAPREGSQYPDLKLRYVSAEGDLLCLDYHLAPVVDPTRLSAALNDLQVFFNLPDVELHPVNFGKLELHLALPSSLAEKRQAVLGPDGCFVDQLKLNLHDAAEVVDSLFGANNVYFTGNVEARIDRFPAELLPFSARIRVANETEKEEALRDIFDGTIPPAAWRTVRVRATFASSDTTGYVIFDGHIQLELKPSRPEGEVVLKANPADYLLRKSNEGKYRYRLKIVLSDKNIVEQPSGGGWLESDDDFLHIRFAPTA